MADNLRQRRGKKAATTSSASSSSEANNPGAGGNPQPTPIEQLQGAQAKLVISRDRTADLHSAWRSQLFLLSLLIVVVTIHQLQSSISSCIREIKDPNNNEGGAKESEVVTGAEAMKLIFGDSFCEILGVFVSSLLAYFLALSNTKKTAMGLDNWPYMVSSALVPVCLGLYFNSKQLGCMGDGDDDLENLDEPPAKDQRHQFPAVVIYHTIVTVAFWFMKSGMQHCEEHVKLVSDSIRDFERMDKKMALKKQLKSVEQKKK